MQTAEKLNLPSQKKNSKSDKDISANGNEKFKMSNFSIGRGNNKLSEEKKKSTGGQSDGKRNRRPRGCGPLFITASVILACIICCVSVFAGLYYTGLLKQYACDNVTSDSPLAQQFECNITNGDNNETDGFSSSEDENNQFPISIGDNQTTDDREISDLGIVAQVYEQTNKSVVGIGVISDQIQGQENIIGSGFVVSSEGLIATNQHVVSFREEEYFVKLEGNEDLIEVKEIYRDTANDLAILRIDPGDLDLPTLTLSSTEVVPGQSVIAIGNPLGEFSKTVTAGIVSGINREVSVSDGSFLRSNISRFEDAIQTDAAINPGNSGGPLLNDAGEVVGINFATVEGADNLSFAIPVSYLITRLNELNEFGNFRIPYIGISFDRRLIQVGRDVFIGARVISIDPNGAAADVLERNDVIISFNGISIEDENLFSLIQNTSIGDEVEIIVISPDGERKTETLTIIESPLD